MDTVNVSSDYKRSGHMCETLNPVADWSHTCIQFIYKKICRSLTPQKPETPYIFDAGKIHIALSIFGGHVLYILFSSCQLALFGYYEVFPCFFLSCKANVRV
jgi:hypothetical protein